MLSSSPAWSYSSPLSFWQEFLPRESLEEEKKTIAEPRGPGRLGFSSQIYGFKLYKYGQALFQDSQQSAIVRVLYDLCRIG